MSPRVDHTKALAEFLDNHPTALAKMLAEHSDDGSGRCRACRTGGARQEYPCVVRVVADSVACRQARRRRVT